MHVRDTIYIYTYTYNNVDMCTKSNISIILHGIQMYEIVPLSFTQDMKER